MSIQSLESERQSILHRMQMSRDGYRHMLTEDSAGDHGSLSAAQVAIAKPYRADIVVEPRQQFPRSATMRLITQHPVACSVAVALLVLVGPRRMMRIAGRSSSKVSELTERNRGKMELMGRGVRLAVQYLPLATRYLRNMRAARRR